MFVQKNKQFLISRELYYYTMSQRKIPHKCPKCGGKTYNCGLLRRHCEDTKCCYFYTGVAIDYHEIHGSGMEIALIENGKVIYDYEVRKQ